ncbi:hypothetical protein Phum_PHUM218550, partial [Pediculus humanus corporis]
VVKGKVTTRCLWNACKALSIGLLLLTIGTSMAVVGYYADQLSIRSEKRGNSTVKIKNESQGFHLNNLSYAGPIIMGIGGFIVVAACVMTFEARDSAAKVVPARFKPTMNSSVNRGSVKSSHTTKTVQRIESKKSTSCQTGTNKYQLKTNKLHIYNTGNEWSPKNESGGLKGCVLPFSQISRDFLKSSQFHEKQNRFKNKFNAGNLNKSPSAPDLVQVMENFDLSTPKHGKSKEKFFSNPSNNLQCTRSPCARDPYKNSEGPTNNLLLRPHFLKRQALSVDNSFYESFKCLTPPLTRQLEKDDKKLRESKESIDGELNSYTGPTGSQVSMALDLHDCQVTLKVKDESANKRSYTSRRHQLLRQKQVEEDKDERYNRCSCIPRFLISPKAEEFHDQRQKINLSSENIKIFYDEKPSCMKIHSPSMSPRGNCRIYECHAHRQNAPKCLIHKSKEFKKNCSLVRSNARKKKSNTQKIEGSLSAEEQNISRGIFMDKTSESVNFRSASFSSSRNLFKSSSSSRNDSIAGGRSPSPKNLTQTQRETTLTELNEIDFDKNNESSKKTTDEPDDPS